MMFQTIFSQNIVSDTIFHEVNRKETLFSISQKYDVSVNDILEFNPKLRNSRLRRRSTILIPVFNSVKETITVIKDSIETSFNISKLDSIYFKKRRKKNQLKVSVLLPFRSATINYDSIKEVESLFDRVLGRTSVHDIYHPETEELTVYISNFMYPYLVDLKRYASLEMDRIKTISNVKTARLYALCRIYFYIIFTY